jgi:predicted PurR-regulated permease PerM
MNETQRDIIGIAFSLTIIGLAAFVTHRFFLPLAWAGILCIATWPLYEKLLPILGKRPIPAALLLTLAMAAAFVIPALLGLRQAIEQAPLMAKFIADANNNGIPPPDALSRIPFFGQHIQDWWLATLSQPHGLSHLFSEDSVSRFRSAREILRTLGTQLVRRLVDFAFSFLCLFFFYKDGHALQRQLAGVGSRWFGERRWNRYVKNVPSAIRATVNGLVLVGLGEGMLIGIGYAIAGLRSPALWAALTGILAIIPFGAPIAFLSAAALLAANGNTAAAMLIAVWGTIVLFIADHFIRPTIIGNATRLPFLAVLFGILGGVEMLGLVGLFIGPVVMALFITLWHESNSSAEFLRDS